MARASLAVVGAGPAGLAAAAMLAEAGVPAIVLEQSAAVGASWRGHYDRLHLHTTRILSDLPGLGIPRRYGRWVPRDGVISYLERYAEQGPFDIRFETRVVRLEPRDGGWLLPTVGGDPIEADQVVIATGYNRRPFLPDWPGREGYAGEVVHAASYRNAETYRDRHVLVAGAGNSGAEIAVDLVAGGAASVRVAVRTPPQIFPRQALGLSAQAVGICLPHLPVPVGDRLLGLLQRIFVGDLTRYGMPRPEVPPYSDYLARGVIPTLDVGLVRLLKRRRVEIVPGIEAFEGSAIRLSDGRHVTADAVIAATGYRRDLEPLVGHLGVLTASGQPVVHGAETAPSAPGVYFIGFTNRIGGQLRELGVQARAIARAARLR